VLSRRPFGSMAFRLFTGEFLIPQILFRTLLCPSGF
jgi:hypothetical protein